MTNTERLKQAFDEASTRPAGAERERCLAEICQHDPELMEQVRSLLRFDVGAGNFLQNTPHFPENPALEQIGALIGRYKLLEKIGEGGCGVVYVAEQAEPVRRLVALKVIKLGMDTKQVVARFEAERQALAMMDHANIAKVLEAGSTATGRPYFVMELVRGIRITEFCDQNELSTRERLELFIKVCQAIQHAHQKGIIHRDIKPSNLLVTLQDGVPVPKVIDFGIAKATEGRLTEATVYTQLLHFIGTPAYMSPEQMELNGLDIDTRSDIYSLGVLLYELLTGQTPFDGQKIIASGIDAMRKTIREEEPMRPSTQLMRGLRVASLESVDDSGEPKRATPPGRRPEQVQQLIRQLKGDLDWIVMKSLEKDRTRRYETANGLAADIHRHLHNEPVVARPPTALYRFQKMVRRNRFAFTAASSVLIALIAGLFLASWQAFRAVRAERATRRSTYALEMNAAFHALIADDNLGQALDLLKRQRPKDGKDDLRGFEWRYLWQLCQTDAFKTFDDEAASAAAFSPDGKWLVYSGNKIIVRDALSLRTVASLPRPAASLCFAPQTNLLASGSDSHVTLWNTTTWQETRSLPDATLPSLFSPDGRWLLTGGPAGFRVWDTQTWQPLGDCPGAPILLLQARNAVAFSPDSQFLVTVAGRNEIGGFLRVWRLPSLEQLPERRFGPRGRPGSVAFSKDGRHLLTGLWDGQLVIQEFPAVKTVATLKDHSNWITMILALPPDGRTIATAGSDRTINLWDATTFERLEPLARLRGHVRGVIALAASTDGNTLISGGGDGTTKLWHASTRHALPMLEGAGLVAGFLGGSRQLVTVTSNGWCLWTPETDARVSFPIPTSPTLIDSRGPSGKPCDVNPIQQLGALGRADGTIEIWDLTTGAMVRAWRALDDGIGAVAFSGDGKLLATGSVKGQVKIWDFTTGRERRRFEPADGHLFWLAFSPDGHTVAASGRSSTVWLWDLTPRAAHRQLSEKGVIVASVAFSPDGKLLATPSLIGNEVQLWDLPFCRNVVRVTGHVGATTAVAFSPDGKTLATAGTDLKVKLWNIATHQELTAIPVIAEFPTLAFSPDGGILAIGEMTGDNRCIQVLHTPSLEKSDRAESSGK